MAVLVIIGIYVGLVLLGLILDRVAKIRQNRAADLSELEQDIAEREKELKLKPAHAPHSPQK